MTYPTDSAYYLFDQQAVTNRVAQLRGMLPRQISLCYAVKANTFIIDALRGAVERFEVCSPGEAQICDRLGVPPEQTVISGVYKTPQVIESMVRNAMDRIYTVESLTQFDLLRSLSESYRRRIPVLLRLTNGSQFGINEDELEQLVAARERCAYLDLLGIQYFSGTQKTSLKKLQREIEHLDRLLLHLQQTYGFTARELEYGPGLPVAYFSGDTLEEEALLSGFSALLNGMCAKPKITLELGRSIAACCGRYYTHVVDIKRNNGQNYLLVDGGMHHIVYFGQHMAMKQPFISVCGKEAQPATESWNICGSLCSMNDILAKQVPLPDIQIGDTLCFEKTGAYCMTEGVSLFLSRELPAVYLQTTDGTICLRHTVQTAPLNTPIFSTTNTERN